MVKHNMLKYGKYGRGIEAIDDNIIRRMRFEFQIIKGRIRTHGRDMKYILLFQCNRCYVNMSQCYFMRTLRVCVAVAIATYS